MVSTILHNCAYNAPSNILGYNFNQSLFSTSLQLKVFSLAAAGRNNQNGISWSVFCRSQRRINVITRPESLNCRLKPSLWSGPKKPLPTDIWDGWYIQAHGTLQDLGCYQWMGCNYPALCVPTSNSQVTRRACTAVELLWNQDCWTWLSPYIMYQDINSPEKTAQIISSVKPVSSHG